MRRLSKTMLLCLVLLSLFFFLAAGAEAGNDRWTPLGLGSGPVASLAVDPQGVLYAAAGKAGLYRSTDQARTWTWRGAATVKFEEWTGVVIAPADPQRLYATTRSSAPGPGKVLTSGDGGLHWRELLRQSFGFSSVAVSRNGVLLAASVLDQVMRSADGGATWSVVLRGSLYAVRSEPQLAFDPLAPETAYVGAASGLWKSTDGGATWQKAGTLPDGQPVMGVAALVFPGTRPGFLYALLNDRIYRSEDGGLTWAGGAEVVGAFTALAVDPADPRTVYAGGQKVWVSHDGGDTATEISSQFPHAIFPDLVALAVSPSSPAALFAAVSALGVFVSHDGGQHWALSEQRGLSAHPFLFGGFRVGASGRLYHEPYSRQPIFRSSDHGATWTPLGDLNSFVDLTEDAGSPEELWVATGSVFHSTDGGATWSERPSGTETQAVASPSPGVVLAGGCGIRRSVDGGRTWTEVVHCFVGDGGRFIQRTVNRFGVAPGWPGRVWAEIDSQGGDRGETTLVLLSQNSGRTWRTLTEIPGDFRRVRLVAGSRGSLYLNGGQALLRSTDAGAHWKVTGSVGDLVTSLAVDEADPNAVAVATRMHGILHSTDGGVTWTDANAGLARLGRLAILDLFADPVFPGVFYALPEQGGIFQIRFGG